MLFRSMPTMTNEQIDAAVPERVMGLSTHTMTLHVPGVRSPAFDECRSPAQCFSPTTDANDDYAVLEHVRETWEGMGIEQFGDELERIWGARKHSHASIAGPYFDLYEPGDYARCALAVLDEEQPHV